MKITKEKVIAKLEKWGNNSKDIKKMVNKNFNVAVKSQGTLKRVCEYIITVY